jgi:hypothetical protein
MDFGSTGRALWQEKSLVYELSRADSGSKSQNHWRFWIVRLHTNFLGDTMARSIFNKRGEVVRTLLEGKIALKGGIVGPNYPWKWHVTIIRARDLR